ncbi:type II secretion system F family protein [Helicobacter sp. 11S02629-2]|uniref:type II secretion system F family protein n=1 Tax=Helicobacter sp. 11S02629-2 TaxID=1476195 RepID=UPI000BA695B5|nr:type II secretion system F family protein [Helicobacter sp. 11S02629-2]PAF45751.1 hypothetical protein BKH40_02425 [Helicobacter sp. 11S02629-2]
MDALFLLTGLFGIFLLVSAVISARNLAAMKKFINLNSHKSMDTKRLKLVLQDYLSAFFKGVYEKGSGFKSKGIIILIISIIAFYVANAVFLNFNKLLVLVVAVIFGAYLARTFYLKAVIKDYENTFPEALVLINGAISSGNNISQALKDAEMQIHGVLKQEFSTISKGLNVGDDPARIFEASYKRLPFKSYYFFLTSLLVSLQSGARLKEILGRLSMANQRAKAIEKKKNAMTSEARMSSKITAAIPFIFLFLMKFISPENFDFVMHNDEGRYILYYFLGSEFLGVLIILFLMRKI